MHCLPSSEMRKVRWLDVKWRHHKGITNVFDLKNGEFRRIIQNVELYPERPAGFTTNSGYHSNTNYVFENRGLSMAVSYNKLWNLVRQNKMKKADLARAAEISEYAMKKLNRDEPVQLEILLRVCKVFHCDIGDLMEVIEEEK